MATLQIKQLKKNYGSVEVLHNITIDIADRSFVSLVGPSGCGKSTLLRTIAGLEDISGGEIFIDNKAINDVAPKDRDIAMVFQNYALYPHMTVETNMGFALKMAKVDPIEIKRRVAEAADTLNLTTYLQRFPRELSGGQRQRVAMGRCIVRKPAVFLFDEPLSNLDAKLRVKMRTEIKALHQRLNATSVYVTHDQMEAMTMSDKIVVMRDGYIEQMGAPLDLYDYPNNLFVATFIGSPSINLFTGKMDANAFVADDGTRIALPRNNTRGTQGQAVQLGIRPEHLDISTQADGIPMQVSVVEPTGNETLISGTLAGQEVQLSLRERHHFSMGETIYVRPQLDKLHLFDQKTTQRIH